MRKIYFLFGGCPENLRAKKLFEKWDAEGRDGTFLVTGYPKEDPGEVDSMFNFLISLGVPLENIVEVASYETFSNVEALEVYITNRGFELKDCRIWASTEIFHWIRFWIIFIWEWLFNKSHPNFFGIKFIPSGEKKARYALTAILCYVIFTPRGFQKITQRIRKNEYELCMNHDVISQMAKKHGVTAL